MNEIVVTASFLSAFCEQSVLDEEMTKIVKVRTKLGVGREGGGRELELESFYKDCSLGSRERETDRQKGMDTGRRRHTKRRLNNMDRGRQTHAEDKE